MWQAQQISNSCIRLLFKHFFTQVKFNFEFSWNNVLFFFSLCSLTYFCEFFFFKIPFFLKPCFYIGKTIWSITSPQQSWKESLELMLYVIYDFISVVSLYKNIKKWPVYRNKIKQAQNECFTLCFHRMILFIL